MEGKTNRFETIITENRKLSERETLMLENSREAKEVLSPVSFKGTDSKMELSNLNLESPLPNIEGLNKLYPEI